MQRAKEAREVARGTVRVSAALDGIAGGRDRNNTLR
jgi:hypothetical protein